MVCFINFEGIIEISIVRGHHCLLLFLKYHLSPYTKGTKLVFLFYLLYFVFHVLLFQRL